MSRKDFEAIAATIKSMYPRDKNGAWANAFADMCARQNPRFDRRRFLKACGVE